MAPKAAVKAQRPPPPANNDIDDYDVDDDPFAMPEPGESSAQDHGQSKKRKEASGLGIDEEVAVAKKARAPAVKLDETRLLSEKGIPRLRRKARDLKFKGKGHEFSDAARLLSFYQLWLDDLFPKAKFLDALSMVEKAGHKKFLRVKRLEWIDEGKPRPPRNSDDDDDDIFGSAALPEEQRDAAKFPAKVAPIFQKSASQRPRTPTADDLDDLFGGEDIYGATPKAPQTAAAPANDVPEDDDLDALMAEEEAQRTAPLTNSLFGGGGSSGGAASRPRAPAEDDDEDDLDALMAEAETQGSNLPKQSSSAASKSNPPAAAADDDDDDLDALMAEAEAITTSAKPPPTKQQPNTDAGADADEEEAMAEMDGLW